MDFVTKILKDELNKLKKERLQIDVATRMALNEAVKKGKTEVKKSITEVYNIKPGSITDSNRKKGLSIKSATNKNLRAEVDAGHTPVNIGSLSKVKQVKQEVGQNVAFASNVKTKKTKTVKLARIFKGGGIQFELKKGSVKTLPSAFRVGKLNNAVFARGKKKKIGFQFDKPRMPIDSVSTISVATAALNVDAQSKYTPVVEQYYAQRLEHHLKRMIDKA